MNPLLLLMNRCGGAGKLVPGLAWAGLTNTILQDQRLHHDPNLVGSSSYIHRNHKTSPSNDEPEQQAIESVATGACAPSSNIPHPVVVVLS